MTTIPFQPNQYPLEPGMRLLEASAGTGKTYSLAHLVLRLLTEKGCPINKILVISFTKATASEIKARISSRLVLALKGLESYTPKSLASCTDQVMNEWLESKVIDESTRLQWASLLIKALENIDSADITTIHGFCSRNLKREAIDVGNNIETEALSEEDNKELILEIIHEYWREEVLSLAPSQVKGLQNAGISIDCLVNSLIKIDNNPSIELKKIHQEIKHNESLSRQFNGWIQNCWDDFVLEWGEGGMQLEEDFRLQSLSWKKMGIENIRPFSIKPRRKRAIELTAWINEQTNKNEKTSSDRSPDYFSIRSNLLIKDYFHPIKIYEIERRNKLPISSLLKPKLQTSIADLCDKPSEMVLEHALIWSHEKLIQRRNQKGVVSYADQLKALDPGKTSNFKASSEFLLERLREKYKVVLVDEFQDTDPVQWRIINQAFSKSKEHFLLMVGDPKQSIYKFRGGDLTTYLIARKKAERIDSLLTNYRSAPKLMKGLNTLLNAGLKYSKLEAPPLISASKENILFSKSGTAPIEIIDIKGVTPTPTSFNDDLPSKALVEENIPVIVTNTILDLLQNHSDELNPHDICVLVSRHEQAENIRKSLEKANLPSRLVSKGDVLDSQTAKNVQLFLECLAHPTNTSIIKLLACSSLMQWDINKINACEQNGEIDEVIIRCVDWANRLQNIGLIGCLSELLGSKNLAMLSKQGRMLGDLQQCADLVQEAIHIKGLDALGAARWLSQQRSFSRDPTPESRRPNSDIAEKAINVITIHRSKGLQYKVVICPYLWQSPPLPNGPLWCIKNSNEWLISLNTGWGGSRNILEAAINESIEESERLAYVALTRAQKKLIIIWSMASRQENNPLLNLLFGKESHEYNRQELTQETMIKWLNSTNGTIKIHTIEALEELRVWKRSGKNIPLKIGPSPKRLLDKSWGRHSYSAWLATKNGHHDFLQNPKAIEEGKDTAQDEVSSKESSLNIHTGLSIDPYEQSPLAIFPRGPLAGDCLHRILQRIDFKIPANSLETTGLIDEELKKSGIDESLNNNIQEALGRLLSIPLGSSLGNFQLNQLNTNQRISELSFDLSLSINGQPITSSDIAEIFKINPDHRFGGEYSELLQELNISSRGFLTGSIDLVFIDKDDPEDARWWVTDWKSNWIGDRYQERQIFNCSPIHYVDKAMECQMKMHHYPLQAHLYLVALHRYLSWRLDNYDPLRHLGGYAYIFIRGIPSLKENKEQYYQHGTPGLFIEEAPLDRVLALDKLLKGGT
ncbi:MULTISPECIES: UvrD-helicase domain-containing protein [Prochlorococcus]|uniref:DNA 3'-5' helicase n=1 Tax=Prochlorococcus marinus (strain SARG / CCMP1375 / SS120) TaxID=167539 RepID=Q7VBK0_PROMA|nr:MULTISPECIES: UvrD-helicase domain-containing protein [Prochlorococcus]AAQ00137.1 ATP-dependent exoDNAse beta subunit [Prochlorococcus marinus subsp. marinus str. CCMP1375]KGG13933.1 Exodeoxyribonuclease V beta chain [Prochlorococcus marinus str. LG]KGG19066.1 Exodeoxyribonuclease V beta chain [Prochlorococcus marinus str. SS2]KGG23394.1 Exodeoxyribonuclease V beta chain [Prochlorococcus marinus str. SS35]KGG32370.1 Exodeoxyribonuclease V beta chain [Prochlorococcus marinus str. SS51]